MVLADRTVIQVLPNGMARRFRHRFVKVLTQRGVRTHRSWKVSYQPDAQRLRVVKARVWHEDGTKEEATTEYETTLSDPSVRVYYDYKQREIRFAKLQPGDVVEIQVTLSDTADYSPFADYFGTIMSLQEASPRRRVEVILKAPKKIRFHHNKPALKGLKHTRRVKGRSQIHTWSAKSVPPFVSQPSMPGWGEVAAYLHISTFRSWSDVAKWYWNLIREQYHVDEALKKKVAQITRGLVTDAQKVKALYRFVTRKIRYVSLSFGIHTHKPYSAPQVLSRRFGDCKDKAMLLSVMLGLVGIKAHPVLVRTRPGGRLGKHPASIAVFDHAIVYVPSLKRYLDGTAEFTGSTDLPFGDQGVDALVVDGGRGTYTRTPVLPAKKNKMERRLDVKLAADGSAVVRESTEITGQLAAEWRYRFQEEARRRELFQKALGRSFPGARIVTLKMKGIEDPERPVKVETTYRVPHLAQKKDGEMTIAFGRTRGSLVQRLAPLSRRRHPVELDYPFVSKEKITLHLPRGVEVKESPRQREAVKSVASKDDTGASVARKLGFRQKVSRAGRVVTLERGLEIFLQRVPVKGYKTFRRFCSSVDSAVADRFVLTRDSKKRGGGS